jgi:transcriptional regulator with XRE-family HTH domain
MRPWGITVTFLAQQLGVSRQYAWQIVHYRTFLSLKKALEIERVIDAIIVQKKHLTTFGERLRAARISAGLTLKQVADLIGYSWVGVERWEKNICLPKPGVLWHLFNLYGLASDPWQRSTAIAKVVGGGSGLPKESAPVTAFSMLASPNQFRIAPYGSPIRYGGGMQLSGVQRKRTKSNRKE